MKCPHCGTENKNNAIFCTNCNAWILGTIYEEEVPAAAKKPEPAETAAPKEKKRRLPIAIGAAAMAALLLFGTILLWPEASVPPQTSSPLLGATVPGTTTLPPTTLPPITVEPALTWPAGTFDPMPMPPANLNELPNYTSSQGNITATAHNGNMYFIANDYAMKTDIPEDNLWIIRLSTNLSGTAGAYLDQAGNLYCIDGTSVTLLDSNVADYRLSASGKGLAYHTEQGLKLYEWGKAVAYGISNVQPLSFCVSPNGKYMAYVTYEPLEGNAPYALNIFTGPEAKRFRLFRDSVKLLGISDDANTVYVLDHEMNLFAVSGTGKVTELGTLGSTDLSQISLPILSSDHRQMLYYTVEGTHLSIDGQPGQFLSARHLIPVAPEGTCMIGGVNGMITFPGDSLLSVVYSHTYYDDTYASVSYGRMTTDLLYISSSGSETALEYDVSEYHAVAGGTSLFYKTTTNELYSVDLLSGEALLLSVEAGTFTVMQGGTYLYYTMDGKLIGMQPDDPNVITYLGEFENPQLYITNADILCVWDGKQLQTFSVPKGTHLQTFTGVESCEGSSCGIVYVITTDGIYRVSPMGKLIRILDYETEVDVTPDEYIEPIETKG